MSIEIKVSPHYAFQMVRSTCRRRNGKTVAVERKPSMWRNAIRNHQDDAHSGVFDPKCRACHEMKQKAGL
jgi:hypothetical protein